ncbi:HdeD family acid-resistance protein [Coprobacter tertius]|uniref:DUF308 domain-containing protein n=1 Tax=Coprobacter tertius TaxID=2944915 RepID=A0ABT1MGR8_9BACT|nr:DUF308 domain-containing protein [Coprobacter tertius]MCP9611839.1 DUF308 domain-containing protein [Coprobacter tertius]
MNTSQWTLVRSLFAIILGIIAIKWPQEVLNYIVIIIGAMFIIMGGFALINYLARRKKGVSAKIPYIPIESIGSILLGLCLAFMPTVFIGFLMYVLGFLLLLAGILQIFSLASVQRNVPVGIIFYVFPILVLIAGVIILFNPFDSMNSVLIFFGISSIVYGVIDIVNYFKFR